MTNAIRLDKTGAPDVLKLVQIDPIKPSSTEAWIEHEAIGVNYLDVAQRKGEVPIALPNGLGLEAAGRVTAIGSAVTNVAVGDHVAYALGPLGSYASGRLYPADRLVKLPETVSFNDAAAIVFKGITAQYLIKSTFKVKQGSVVLLYGAAGGLGQILAPWAKHLGATVIGVVSKAESADRALAAGCDTAFVWGMPDLPAQLKAFAGQKADVVYDGIGKLTFATSLDCLAPRGTMVSIGASSGAPPAMDVGTLNAKGSLFLTRPGLGAHATDLNEYRARVEDVFNAVKMGIIQPRIAKQFDLKDVAAAHRALENGSAGGTVLLTP